MLMTNLRKIREQKSLTQAEVAYALGWSPNAISNYETGARNMSIETLEKYLEFLNYKIELVPIVKARTFPTIDFSDSEIDWFQLGRQYFNEAWDNYENVTFENQNLFSHTDSLFIQKNKKSFLEGLEKEESLLSNPYRQNSTVNSTFIFTDWAEETLKKYGMVTFEIDCKVFQKEIENFYSLYPSFRAWFDNVETKVTVKAFSMFLGDFDFPLYEKLMNNHSLLRSIAYGK